ncbi:unnamed protein product [Staurois parvus]|uniref:Uncharacterized protein n=1 Tax=Staurois parvus TaxID=386267 RepID=A0ABN9AB53_9NEOB|nr:unnamed protein product [Staurois parvus]
MLLPDSSTLLTILYLPPLSANPSTGLHPSLPIPPLASIQCPPPPLFQSLHWPPLSVLHPSLPIPPLASIQCPPPLSANPSTGLHSVSFTPLCHSPPLAPVTIIASDPRPSHQTRDRRTSRSNPRCDVPNNATPSCTLHNDCPANGPQIDVPAA